MRSSYTAKINFTSLINKNAMVNRNVIRKSKWEGNAMDNRNVIRKRKWEGNAMVNRNVIRKRKSDEGSDQAVDKTAANVYVRLICGYYLLVIRNSGGLLAINFSSFYNKYKSFYSLQIE